MYTAALAELMGTMDSIVIQNVRFDEKGLIPAIVQDAETNDVIGLYYMDNDALLRTLKSGKAYFFSGESEGFHEHFRLIDVRLTGSGSSLTVLVETSSSDKSNDAGESLLNAFESEAAHSNEVSLVDVGSMDLGITINDLYTLITERKEKRPEGSYTSYLFNSGLDKILKKVAEESGEVIIAAKNKSQTEIVCELSDLLYHLLVLMVERNVKLADVQAELARRSTGSPNHVDAGKSTHPARN